MLFASEYIISTADLWLTPCWLLATGLLVLVGWLGGRKWFPQDHASSCLLHTLVLCWGEVVLWGFVLSLCKCLCGLALLLTVTVSNLVLLWVLRRRVHFPVAMLPAAQGKGWGLLWMSLAALALGHVFADGLLHFPDDWDTLAYHLPLMDQWLQAGSLHATDIGRWSEPGNNELWGLWWVAPFSGDFLCHLVNMPAVLLLASSVLELARQMGMRPFLTHVAGVGAVCHYVVLKQLVDVENDVAAAGSFIAALSYLLRFLQRNYWPDLFLGAFSLGLMAGIKFYALGYAVWLLFCWCGATGLLWGKRRVSWVFLVCLGGLFGFGAYWYLRNWLLTGSPLYPKQFWTQNDLLQRIYPEVAYTSFLGNRRPELLPLYLEAIWRLLGPLQAGGLCLAPLGILYLLGRSLYGLHAGEKTQSVCHLTLAVALLGSGALLLITPFAIEDKPGTLNQLRWHYCPVRYGLCFLTLASLTALWLLQEICRWLVYQGMLRWCLRKRNYQRWYLKMLPGLPLIVGGGAAYQLYHTAPRLHLSWEISSLWAANLLLGWLVLFLMWQLWPRRRTGLIVLLLLLGVAGGSWGMLSLAERWHKGYVDYYDRFLAGGSLRLLMAQAPLPGRVAALLNRCYPLFGSGRQQRLCQPVFVFSPSWLQEYFQAQQVVAVVWHPPRGHWRRFLGFEEYLRRQPGVWQRRTAPTAPWQLFWRETTTLDQ
jgi:hypothetical protein